MSFHSIFAIEKFTYKCRHILVYILIIFNLRTNYFTSEIQAAVLYAHRFSTYTKLYRMHRNIAQIICLPAGVIVAGLTCIY